MTEKIQSRKKATLAQKEHEKTKMTVKKKKTPSPTQVNKKIMKAHSFNQQVLQVTAPKKVKVSAHLQIQTMQVIPKNHSAQDDSTHDQRFRQAS